ncbi:MAG: hypothetical protein WC626_13815 [Methanoregula sp.]
MEPAKYNVVPKTAFLLIWCLALVPLFFCIWIFFVDSIKTYQFYSNILEIGIALFCMCCCLYAYRTWSERIILLLAAFAFLGYALSNTFWYIFTLIFDRTTVFFNISQMGFLGFMLFFIAAFWFEFPKKPCPRFSQIALIGLLVFITLLIITKLGVNGVSVLLWIHVLFVILFINSALEHGVYRYSLLWIGIFMWSFPFITSALRDTFIVTHSNEAVIALSPTHPLTLNELLSIDGPLIVLSFLLIQLGIFAYLNSLKD